MIIPIVPTTKTEDVNSIGFYISTDPTDDDAEKVKIYVNTYETGDIEDLMNFVTSFKDLCRLKGIEENGPALFTNARLLLKEDALEAFNDAHDEVTEDLDENDDQMTSEIFDETWQQWLANELQNDENTAKELKRDLWSSNLKKPSNLPVTSFVKRLKKINKFIDYLPGEETRLTNNELQLVLENAVPPTWKVDLQKRADYGDDMTLAKALKYFKLLEKLETPKVQQDKPMKTKQDVTHNDNDKLKPQRDHDQYDLKTGQGSNRTLPLRRSQRRKGPYCPHHRTTDHDGQNCPEYQQYLRTRNQNHDRDGKWTPDGRYVSKSKEEVNMLDDFDDLLTNYDAPISQKTIDDY